MRIYKAALVRDDHSRHAAELGHGVWIPAIRRHTTNCTSSLLQEFKVFLFVACTGKTEADTNDGKTFRAFLINRL